MQTLGLDDENPIETRKRFWRRQFQEETTKSQNRFDWIFGVIMPVVCFFFDPIVFKGGFEGALLGAYKPFAYLLSFVSIMAMMAWLLWREKLKWLSAPLAGLFAVGGIVSLAVGIILSPFSLLGLIILIGVLGFTPLFTSVVYLRNSVRAVRAARPFLEKRVLAYSIILSGLFSIVVPYVVNVEIKHILTELTTADARAIRIEARKLRFVAPLVDFGPLAERYRQASEEERRTERMTAIAKVYRNLTGEEVEKTRGF